MTGLRPAAELAELGVLRSINAGLQLRVADAAAITERRAREEYARGLAKGRAGVLVGLLIGAGIGFGLTAAAFALFG